MTKTKEQSVKVVKSRDDQFYIIPVELLDQCKVLTEKTAEILAQYESDVEGQIMPELMADRDKWIVGDDDHLDFFAPLLKITF